MWREAAGLRQAELGAAIGYGEEMVSSVERGRRIPRPDFLDRHGARLTFTDASWTEFVAFTAER